MKRKTEVILGLLVFKLQPSQVNLGPFLLLQIVESPQRQDSPLSSALRVTAGVNVNGGRANVFQLLAAL
jgi:hypothetical protein